MTKIWRFLDTGKNPGVYNMALDEAILEILEQGKTAPSLRLYQWSPACLSLGRNQGLKTINLGSCKKLGIDVVRRPTGGEAILHWDELTYSVIMPRENPSLSLKELYFLINRALIEAFYSLGIKTELHCLKESLKNPNCFLSAGLADLCCHKKKLVGSAQLRTRGAILQHGSIIISHKPEILFSVFRFPSKKLKKEEFSTFSKKATSLSEIIGEINLTDLKKVLLAGFQNVLNLEFFEGKLTGDEILETEKLLEKYKKLNWEIK